MWSAQRELNAALGIEINDLVQEDSLGLLDCIAGFKPETGNRFLTYAAPAIRNAMVDYIRRWNPTFEAKNLGNIVHLDDVVKDENTNRHEFIADYRIKNRSRFILPRKPTKKSILLCRRLIGETGHTSGIVLALRTIWNTR